MYDMYYILVLLGYRYQAYQRNYQMHTEGLALAHCASIRMNMVILFLTHPHAVMSNNLSFDVMSNNLSFDIYKILCYTCMYTTRFQALYQWTPNCQPRCDRMTKSTAEVNKKFPKIASVSIAYNLLRNCQRNLYCTSTRICIWHGTIIFDYSFS